MVDIGPATAEQGGGTLMQWWNCNLAMLRAPLPAAATPAAFGAWVRVMGYACEQECGGVLRGAANWSDRQWIAACNVTAGDLREARDLLVIEGEDVIVWGYPRQRQTELESMRSEGAAGGSARTSAKSAAARMNGRLGGRPRVRELETQEPNGTQRKPNETQHPKPTAFAFTSENGTENPRERKGIGSVSVVDGFPAERVPGATATPEKTTTTPRISFDGTGPDPSAENSDQWRARLATKWPQVNLESEFRRAEAYVRQKRGNGAVLHRRFFESVWLPRAAEPAATLAGSSSVKVAADTEPAGWREVIAESQYGPGGLFEVQNWAQLPAYVRAVVRSKTATENS